MECKFCGFCCKTVSVEIDKPETKEEIENIKWFLYHKGINLLIDIDGTWFVEFKARCKNLIKNNRCKIYDKRPPICRSFSPEECIKTKGEREIVIKTIKELEDYLKGIKI